MSCQINLSSTSSNDKKRKLVPLLQSNIKKSKSDIDSSLFNFNLSTNIASISPPDSSSNCSLDLSPLKNDRINLAKIIDPINNKRKSQFTDRYHNQYHDQNNDHDQYHEFTEQLQKPKHLKSCSRCRKHKTKCNYIETAPNACSSCLKRGLICQLEVVIPVKRSNIIKNLSNDIENLKDLVDDLILKDKYLKSLCKEKGIEVDGLINIENCRRDFSDIVNNNILNTTTNASVVNNTVTSPIETTDTTTTTTTTTTDNDFIYEKQNNSNKQIYHSINNILSKFEDVLTPPNSNLISPDLSDNENENNNNLASNQQKEPNSKDLSTQIQETLMPTISLNDYTIYNLNDCCCFSHYEIDQIFQNFNLNYLPFIPIFDKITSIEKLFESNKLLFWSIVYIISGNVDIYTKFIIKKILQFLNSNDENELDSYNSIVAILLLCCFPTKIKSTKFDIDDELDTSIFQWLENCKLKCLNFNNIEKYIDDNENNNFKKNIWCVIFILGNFYGFRLGLKWNQPIDYILEESKDKNSYLGQLLNITILFSKLLDHLVFENNNNNNNNNNNDNNNNQQLLSNNEDHLLLKSLSNWKFKLSRMKNNQHFFQNNLLNSNLNISFDFLELIFTLFEPQNLNLSDQIDRIFKISENFYSNIENLNVINCPIFLKISLEFFCLVLTKLSYCPQFLNKKSNSNLYVNLFNKLISFVEFNDTKIIFNTLMDFDSSVKIDPSLIDIFNMNSFKLNLMPGLIKDLKKLIQKFKSIEINDSRISKNKVVFNLNNLDYQIYSENFNALRNQVDLVIIYSNEILKLSNQDNDIKNGSLTSTIISTDDNNDNDNNNNNDDKTDKTNMKNIQIIQPSQNQIIGASLKGKDDFQLQSQIDDDIEFLNNINWIN